MFNNAFYPGAALKSFSAADLPVDNIHYIHALKAECPIGAKGVNKLIRIGTDNEGSTGKPSPESGKTAFQAAARSPASGAAVIRRRLLVRN